jgi:pyrimidine-nucleoside phosphorylase
MLHSGTVFDLSALGLPTCDKHSTGGIGDKASIPLAPAVAACGVAVPMISGRGLGHTGGTLDKLESIPRFRTDLNERQFRGALKETGVALAAQTADLVPADRKLYALRDVTGLVASIPLIASSIMSKKLAEGAAGLVLDVKFGSGAFLPEVERGRELARAMLSLAEGMGVKARAVQTAMDRPLGRAVGHTLEILESLECLRGEGPADLRQLVCVLGGEMLTLAGIADSTDQGEARIARALDDGSAMERFESICLQQGARPGKWFDHRGDPQDTSREDWCATQAGHLRFADLRDVGRALVALGGGRKALDDVIDPGVGFLWHARSADAVAAGQPLCTIHHRDGRGLEEARALLARAVTIGPAFEPSPLVLARL